MDRIFSNSTPRGFLAGKALSPDATPEDAYLYTVRSLIEDANDYEFSELAPARETLLEYYYAQRPAIDADEEDDLLGDPPTDESTSTRSSVVSSDVRDTVLSILPSLMRIFAGTEHAIEFQPNGPQEDEYSKQATDYIRYKFWKQNKGFNTLYDTFWDALTVKTGAMTWGTDTGKHVSVQNYNSMTHEQLAHIMSQEELGPEIVSYDPPKYVPGLGYVINNVAIRYTKSVPNTWVESIAPEDIRITRGAKSTQAAPLIGYVSIMRIGELVAMGYEYDEILEHAGNFQSWSMDSEIRSPGVNTGYPLNDQVLYGCFWIRADGDGDGIDELRHICTMGENYEIVHDEPADIAKMALFSGDRRPHSAMGNSMAELVLDIQRIKTNLIRGGLDSLAQSIFNRTAFNELLVNVEDVMSDDIGAPIRTRGNPAEVIQNYSTTFVGKDAFEAADYLDRTRVARTGISDASKGVDPKVFQSTNLSGIDAIVSGAQERIELIARLFAEGGLTEMYEGLLTEVTNNPNRSEMVQLRGKWVEVNPSLYNPNMRVEVNPMLGKGSDQTRLLVLQGVAATQSAVVEKFGLGNGVVGPIEMRNTQVDILSLVNFKNANRYFREITPEQQDAIEKAPKEPSPEMVLAQSQMENVRSKTSGEIGKQRLQANQQKTQAAQQASQMRFNYDKLHTDAFVALTGFLKDAVLAEQETDGEVMKLSEGG